MSTVLEPIQVDQVGRILEMYAGKIDTRGLLANVAEEVGNLPYVRRMVRDFDDRTKYPDRPVIVLHDGQPQIYLLGWREGDATEPHDHGTNHVGIYVVQGIITEDIYITAPFRGKDRTILTEFSRDARMGDLITCPATGYIHRVGNMRPIIAATVHVYGPVLDEMITYQRNGQVLEFKEHWYHTSEVAHH